MNNNLFMDTTTTQYGSHMVMTGTRKPIRNIYINIDTKFRDITNNSTLADYTINLPEKINSVHSMEVISIEIPYTIYNISSAIGNNKFYISDNINDIKNIKSVIINDGTYNSPENIITALNSSIQELDSSYNTFALNIKNIGDNNYSYMCILDNSAGLQSLQLNFGNISNNLYDLALMRGGLGWKLGFRNLNYVIKSGETISGETFIDIYSPKYLFLVIDDFAKGTNSFIAPFNKGLMNKHIIARIPIPTNKYNFGEIIQANIINGTMVSDIRNYIGNGNNLQKLRVQLVDEYGSLVDLNEMDFSFVLKLEIE